MTLLNVENMMETLKEDSPLNPNCLAAGMGSDNAEDVCNGTMDANGKSCTWCSVAGVYGLCLSQDGAEMAHDYIQCDGAVSVM